MIRLLVVTVILLFSVTSKASPTCAERLIQELHEVKKLSEEVVSQKDIPEHITTDFKKLIEKIPNYIAAIQRLVSAGKFGNNQEKEFRTLLKEFISLVANKLGKLDEIENAPLESFDVNIESSKHLISEDYGKLKKLAELYQFKNPAALARTLALRVTILPFLKEEFEEDPEEIGLSVFKISKPLVMLVDVMHFKTGKWLGLLSKMNTESQVYEYYLKAMKSFLEPANTQVAKLKNFSSEKYREFTMDEILITEQTLAFLTLLLDLNKEQVLSELENFMQHKNLQDDHFGSLLFDYLSSKVELYRLTTEEAIKSRLLEFETP